MEINLEPVRFCSQLLIAKWIVLQHDRKFSIKYRKFYSRSRTK